MSEYQYYEFQAIDRPLSEADRTALRALSTRARITATSFTNSYEWGDFKGDPAKLMARWFDLHLYLANWGSRRLMIRFPCRTVNRGSLRPFLRDVDTAELSLAGENLILDVAVDEIEDEDWDDGAGSLAALAPLRGDVLSGDLRLFYLIWLMAVEAEDLGDEETEPLPGIGPLTGPLEAFAEFFCIDSDLVAAAAERCSEPAAKHPASSEAARSIISSLSEQDKTGLLARVFDGDAHVTTELRALVRRHLAAGAAPVSAVPRTVGDLRARAEAIRRARERAEAQRVAAEQRRTKEKAERERRTRLADLARRGESVWEEVETEIARANAPGYDRAASLLLDLRAVAEEEGAAAGFARRLATLREKHARKRVFIMRLANLDQSG
jgi:hypothetical protein